MRGVENAKQDRVLRISRGILPYLPRRPREWLTGLSDLLLADIEEFRLRVGSPVSVITSSRHYFLAGPGSLTKKAVSGYIFTKEDAAFVLERISQSSVYAFEEEVRSGFITLEGGHRVGLAGRAVTENGSIRLQRQIACFNFRVAREVFGAADKVLPLVTDRKKDRVLNTLIISPPRAGKTTLLRDVVRQLSTGIDGFSPLQVALIDERGEIAACRSGVPGLDVGPCTDVLDGCPKTEGILMAIRSLGPDVIATDEIGSKGDSDAVFEALNAGVSVIATVHGASPQDVNRRPALKRLNDSGAFERLVTLSRRLGPGTLEGVEVGVRC